MVGIHLTTRFTTERGLWRSTIAHVPIDADENSLSYDADQARLAYTLLHGKARYHVVGSHAWSFRLVVCLVMFVRYLPLFSVRSAISLNHLRRSIFHPPGLSRRTLWDVLL